MKKASVMNGWCGATESDCGINKGSYCVTRRQKRLSIYAHKSCWIGYIYIHGGLVNCKGSWHNLPASCSAQQRAGWPSRVTNAFSLIQLQYSQHTTESISIKCSSRLYWNAQAHADGFSPFFYIFIYFGFALPRVYRLDMKLLILRIRQTSSTS